MRTGNFFAGRSYTQLPVNRFGLDNHFQGIQPLPDARYWIFSGADFLRRQASLFIAKLGEAGANIVQRLDIGDDQMWHAGGITRFESILAVPLEAYRIARSSRILFYDVSESEAPKPYAFTIERPSDPAGAVALTRMADGKYLLLVYDNGRVDFYQSRTERFKDGFEDDVFVRRDWGHIPEVNGSSLGFIRQCDGALFLTSFKNTGKAPPLWINGRDYAGLAVFTWNNGHPEIQPRAHRHYHCGTGCNFSAAAGSYLNEAGGLSVLSTYSFRNETGTQISMRIFD